MHLRHGHGDAAGDPRQPQQVLQRARAQPGAAPRECRGRLGAAMRLDRHASAQQQRQRHDGRDGDPRQRQVDRAPAAFGQQVGQQRGPERAREVVAAGRQRHGDAPPAQEPVRDIGDQRPEPHRRAQAQQQMGQRQRPDRRHQRGQHEPRGDPRGRPVQRDGHAEPVHHPSDQQVAQGKAHHGQRIGQRSLGPARAELGLDRGHDDHDRPHAHIGHHADGQCHPQPEPGITAVVDVSALHGRDVRPAPRRSIGPVSAPRRGQRAQLPR